MTKRQSLSPMRRISKSICKIDGCERPIIGQGLCNPHYRRLKRHGDPLAGQKTYRGEPLTFLERAVASQQDACIEWPFSQKNGYGEIYIDGVKTTAHRAVLLRTIGPPLEPSMDAAHAPEICHNRLCINPRHLRWASRRDNAADRSIDGTENRGERNGSAKLTAEDIRLIRRLALSALHREIATSYGISRAAVTDIVRRKTWGWLND